MVDLAADELLRADKAGEAAERKRAFRKYAQTDQARELLDRMNGFAGFEGRP